MKIHLTDRIKPEEDFIILASGIQAIEQTPLDPQEQEYIMQNYREKERESFFFNRLSQQVWVYLGMGVAPLHAAAEHYRKKGDEIAVAFAREGKQTAVIMPVALEKELVMAFAEGMALGSYHFGRHKSKESEKKGLSQIKIAAGTIEEADLKELAFLVQACYFTRDLVNEPGNLMNTAAFSDFVLNHCRKAGAVAQVFKKDKIEQLGMEGLLNVNKGSKTDPAFIVVEWLPSNAVNEKPVVLAGKGLVFDTGGINLKPSKGLETMKSDMAGGAAVFGVMYALAMNKLPVGAVGLIPVTDNRPGEQAMLPGDIIRMGNGKTVEVINTDAEGRLILADALLYAQNYNPELVIDIATLTGSATMAVGKHGMVGMQQGADAAFEKLKTSGWKVYERIAELPFWDEYADEMVSDIADLRNIGKGNGGGAITAGKFLAAFVSFPWIHLDIAGVAFMDARESYRGKGGTAAGVRLLYDFLKNYKPV